MNFQEPTNEEVLSMFLGRIESIKNALIEAIDVRLDRAVTYTSEELDSLSYHDFLSFNHTDYFVKNQIMFDTTYNQWYVKVLTDGENEEELFYEELRKVSNENLYSLLEDIINLKN